MHVTLRRFSRHDLRNAVLPHAHGLTADVNLLCNVRSDALWANQREAEQECRGKRRARPARPLLLRTVSERQNQTGDSGGEHADQRRAVQQLQAEAGNHVTLFFVQTFNRTRYDAD